MFIVEKVRISNFTKSLGPGFEPVPLFDPRIPYAHY
jgi:hypothetical protein